MPTIVRPPFYLTKTTRANLKSLGESRIFVKQMRSFVVNISLGSADLVGRPNRLKSIVAEPHNVPMIDDD